MLKHCLYFLIKCSGDNLFEVRPFQIVYYENWCYYIVLVCCEFIVSLKPGWACLDMKGTIVLFLIDFLQLFCTPVVIGKLMLTFYFTSCTQLHLCITREIFLLPYTPSLTILDYFMLLDFPFTIKFWTTLLIHLMAFSWNQWLEPWCNFNRTKVKGIFLFLPTAFKTIQAWYTILIKN